MPRSVGAQAFDALHGGGLAGAVGADQAEDLARLDVEGDVVDGHGTPVGLADAGDVNGGLGHVARPFCHAPRAEIAVSGGRAVDHHDGDGIASTSLPRRRGTTCRPGVARSRCASRSCASCSTRSIRRRSRSAISIPRPSSSSSTGAATCRRSAPLALVVHLDRAAGPPEEAALLRDAIHEFFRQRAVASRRQLRELFRRGRTSLAIALMFLAASIAASDALAMSFPDSHVTGVLREGLLIVGWVAMWRPAEVFLYDWWPIRAEARLYDRLSAMPVRIEYHAATAEDAWRRDWPAQSTAATPKDTMTPSAHAGRRAPDPRGDARSHDRGLVPGQRSAVDRSQSGRRLGPGRRRAARATRRAGAAQGALRRAAVRPGPWARRLLSA